MPNHEEVVKDWRLLDPRYDEELWTFEYDNSPYLERTGDIELDIRYEEILHNIEHLVCPLRDQVPIEEHHSSSWWWLKVKFQTEYEYRRRGQQLPALKVPLKVPDYPVPYAPGSPNEAAFLVKYGEVKYLAPMLKNGIIRVNPASAYKGEVVRTDIARYDDELNLQRYTSGNRIRATLRRTGQSIPIRGNLKQTTGSLRDYYVICCSHEFDYRLFSAFKNDNGEPADSCLVIHNVEEFESRLKGAVQLQLEDWEFYANPVFYFDPHNSRDATIRPGANKDFKYAYQREYRFLWYPVSSDPGQMAPFNIQIGSLEDTASLHRNP
jgi:hypothetical protein